MKIESIINSLKNVGVKLDFTLNSSQYRAESCSAPTIVRFSKSCLSLYPENHDSDNLICLICCLHADSSVSRFKKKHLNQTYNIALQPQIPTLQP